jgi:hypothetical protein
MDIRVTDHGSIMLFTGVSDAGRAWIQENLIQGTDEVQVWGPRKRPGVAIERRYLDHIVEGARADGLDVE